MNEYCNIQKYMITLAHNFKTRKKNEDETKTEFLFIHLSHNDVFFCCFKLLQR